MAAFPEEFSSPLIKFPVNEGQKISNLVICCKMIIYRLSERNCVPYIEKLQKNQIEKKKSTVFLFLVLVCSKKRRMWPTLLKPEELTTHA